MSLLVDPGFKVGVFGWRVQQEEEAVSFRHESMPGIARTGSHCAVVGTMKPGGSIVYDITLVPKTISSFTLLAWVRSRPGNKDVSGTLALWDLTTHENESCNFVASQSWQFLSVMFSLDAEPTSKLRTFRTEFYVHTTFADLLIDSVNLM